MGPITMQKIDGFKEHWNSLLEHVTDVHQIGMYKKLGRDLFLFEDVIRSNKSTSARYKKEKQVMKEKVGQKVHVAVDLGCLAAFAVWNQQEQWTGTGLCFSPPLACKHNSFDSNFHQ